MKNEYIYGKEIIFEKKECYEDLEQIIIRIKNKKWKKYYLISIFFDENFVN